MSRTRSIASLVAVGLGLGLGLLFLNPSDDAEKSSDRSVSNVPTTPPAPPRPAAAGPRAAVREGELAPEEPESMLVATSTYTDTVRESFRAAMRALGRTPTEGELTQMTQSVLRMKASRAALRAIEYEAGHGQELRRLRDEIAQAGADFKTAAGMSLSELTARTTEGGVTPSVGADPETDAVFELLPEKSP